MRELLGQQGDLGWVAVKSALLVFTAVLGFRLVGRRTMAEMTGYDFVAAVAVGAIVGRVPNSSTTSYLQGATTLVTIFVVHATLTRLRRHSTRLRRVLDHPPLVVLAHGELDRAALRRCGLTGDDLDAALRGQGVRSRSEVDLAVVETAGAVSILRTGTAAQGQPAGAGPASTGALWRIGRAQAGPGVDRTGSG